jgi:hypothetical protein
MIAAKNNREGLKRTPMLGNEHGKVGWILLWAIGVPVPVLFLLFLVRGST